MHHLFKKSYLLGITILIIIFFVGQNLYNKTDFSKSAEASTLSDGIEYTIPVLSLSYLPVDKNNSNNIDLSITGPYLESGTTISTIRQKINRINGELITGLENGSSYHKYKDSSSKSALNYYILESKEFLRPILRTNNNDWIYIDQGDWGLTANHYEELSNINICDYVENKGIKEVWIWMYHYGPDSDGDGEADLDQNRYHVSPTESNMSGPYGDISNSYRINDLPVCKKTYVVYEYNYTRDFGEAIEDHTHQIEATLREADSSIFWDKFVGPSKGTFSCGWTHCPPNVMSQCSTHNYDWTNGASVVSNCEDWKENGTGTTKTISCHTWAGSVCGSDSGDKFKVWWMQNIPRSWWAYIGDFDNAMKNNVSLKEPVLINGSCGTAQKTYSYNIKTYGKDKFCATGNVNPSTPAFPSQGNSIAWTCVGANGGTTASCSASRKSAPINGSCGTANKNYSLTKTSYGTDTFCITGTTDPITPIFPELNIPTSWTCVGSNGGTTASCSATIDNNVPCTSFSYSWSECLNGKQTKIVTESIPSGCIGGEIPEEETKDCSEIETNSPETNQEDDITINTSIKYPAPAIIDAKNKTISIKARANFSEKTIKIEEMPLAPSNSEPILVSLLPIASTSDSSLSAIAFDDDSDGLPNDMEKRLGTDPKKEDTDGDGLNDKEELKIKTDPLKPLIKTNNIVLSEIDKAILADKSLEQPKSTANINESLTIDSIKTVKSNLIFQGKAEPNQVVTLFIYSAMPIIATIQSESDGNWKYELDKNLIDGEHEAYLVINNSEGKILEASASKPFSITEGKIVSSGNQEPAPPIKNMMILYIFGGLIMISFLIAAILIIKQESSK